MFSSAIMRIRKCDETFFKSFIADTENNYNSQANKHIIKLFNIKAVLIEICYLNKQLQQLNNEVKNDLSLNNRNSNITLCENVKNDIKKLLKIIKQDELNSVKKHLLLKQINKIKRKQKEKYKQSILKNIYYNQRRNRLIINIDNWMKSKQNEIDQEKEKKMLHKNADIILSDVRANRIEAKKFFVILKDLKNLRKIKVGIARKRGEVIPMEADAVFNNIIDKLIEQWLALDREYLLEEKGLKLMIRTGNEQKILKRTKNMYEEWETVLFEKKKSINEIQKENLKFFTMLRMVWDTYININGSTIPVGWIIPFKSLCQPWEKYLKEI